MIESQTEARLRPSSDAPSTSGDGPRARSDAPSAAPVDRPTAWWQERVPGLVARLAIAGLAAIALGSVAFLVWAVNRGLDLTDEGIYLNIYRHWRNPELNFTGAPVLAGPIFQLFGWRVGALRLVKIVVLVASSAFLGTSTVRYVYAHLGHVSLRAEKRLLVVLATVVGSFSLYAWLPQTPGYNDLAIMLNATVVALVLRWALVQGRRATLLSVIVGLAIMLLFLVKWPSAIFTAAGVTAFVVASGRARRFVAFLAGCAGGGVLGLLYAQIVGGNVIHRIQVIRGATDVVLSDSKSGLTQTYLSPYAHNVIDTASTVTRIAGPVLVPGFVLAAALVWFGKRNVAGFVYAATLGALVLRARKSGYLTGGESHVVQLESTFPIFVMGALGVVALAALWRRRGGRVGDAGEAPATVPVAVEEPGATAPVGRRLWAGILLVLAAPLLQALGTGNPMFRIAFAAGAGWTAAVGAMMIVASQRDRWLQLPALSSLVALSAVGLLAGVQGLLADSFRVGPLRLETVAVPSSPTMRGLRVDPTAADLVARTIEVLKREGAFGKPGFATMNGTGLTFAVGMPAPLAGMFVEEPLPNVLRGRIKQACKLGYISATTQPVVLSLGDGEPPVTGTTLRSCGVPFPSAYRSFRIKPVAGGYPYLRDVGITVWIPSTLKGS